MAFPDDRPVDYSPTLQWNTVDRIWQAVLSLENSDGGRNLNRILVIGYNPAEELVIYFN